MNQDACQPVGSRDYISPLKEIPLAPRRKGETLENYMTRWVKTLEESDGFV